MYQMTKNFWESLIAPYACEDCEKAIDELNGCSFDSEGCPFCEMCCPGHCNECNGTDSQQNADGAIYKCDICESFTHCDFAYCDNGGFSCRICNRICCFQCKNGKMTCKICNK